MRGVVLDSKRQGSGAALLKPHMSWLFKENAATQWTPWWPRGAVLRVLRTGSLTLLLISKAVCGLAEDSGCC